MAKTPVKKSTKSPAKKSVKSPAKKSAKSPVKKTPTKKVKLLTGGNPQIAKGDGDAPVQAYIAAMPGWKSAVGKKLDKLIEKSVPHLKKAVKWNAPFYGTEENGWFLSIHCYTKRVNIAFFKGMSLKPLPPGESKQPDVRYFDIHEDDEIDEKQFLSWVKQAAEIPGWIMG